MRKKNTERNRFFSSLPLKAMISVLSVVCIIMVSMLVVYVNAIRTAIVNEYHALVQTSVSNIDTAFSQYITNTNTYCVNYYSDVNCVKIRLDKANHSNLYGMSLEARKTFQVLPNIHSFCILDLNNSLAHSVTNEQTSQFTDDLDAKMVTLLDEATSARTPLLWEAKNRYTDQMVPLLTLYYREATPESPSYRGTITFNINTESLSKYLFSNEAKETDITFFVLNSAGQIAAHSDAAFCGEDWAQKNFVQDILTGRNGFWEIKENRSTYEIYAIPSSIPGFYVVAQYPQTNGFAQGGNSLMHVIGAVAMIAIVALAFLIFLFHKIFKPFNQIVEGARTAPVMQDQEHNGDDIATLNQYHMKMSTYVETVKHNDIKNQIVKTLLKQKEVERFLLNNQYIQSNGSYYLLLAHLDREQDVVKPMTVYEKYRKEFEKTCITNLSKQATTVFFEIGFRRMMVLIRECNEELPLDALQTAVGQIQNHMMMEYDLQTTCYLSQKICVGEADRTCQIVFQRGEFCLKTRRFLDTESPLVLITEAQETECWKKQLEAVIRNAQKSNESGFSDSVEQLLEGLKNESWELLSMVLLRLVTRLTKMRNANVLPEGFNHTIMKKINTLESKETLINWLMELFDDSPAWIQTANGNSSLPVMEKTMNYINTNYADKDLNLNTLAEQMHISAPYLGRLFRSFNGTSFNEYLMKVRMEQAGTLLLLNKNLSVAEISDKVGFSNNSYFTASFKNYYGMTPTQYRKNKTENEQ